MTPEEIRKRSRRKAGKIDDLIDEIENNINQSARALTHVIIWGFLQKLKSENGKIYQTINTETVTLLNRAFATHVKQNQRGLIKKIVKDLGVIIGENENYYRDTVAVDTEKVKQIRKIINRRLGISENGKLVKDGYMSGLLDDTQVRAEIQKFIYQQIIKGVGYEELRESLKIFIQGDEKKLGAYNKYYNAFSYDTYAQINAMIGKEYAEEFKMEYFIYNGGKIKTSREFCIKRDGNVYTNKEADKWKDDVNLKAIQSKETYNWQIDRGGV